MRYKYSLHTYGRDNGKTFRKKAPAVKAAKRISRRTARCVSVMKVECTKKRCAHAHEVFVTCP